MTPRDKWDAALAQRCFHLVQAGMVRRFHTMPGGPAQTTAEHSGRVALLVMVLTGGHASRQLLWKALIHDLGEAVTGDIPAPAKWLSATLGESLDEVESRVDMAWNLRADVTVEEDAIFRLADALDGMLTCIQERRRGNLEMGSAFYKWRSYVLDQWSEASPMVVELTRMYVTPEEEWDPWKDL